MIHALPNHWLFEKWKQTYVRGCKESLEKLPILLVKYEEKYIIEKLIA